MLQAYDGFNRDGRKKQQQRKKSEMLCFNGVDPVAIATLC